MQLVLLIVLLLQLSRGGRSQHDGERDESQGVSTPHDSMAQTSLMDTYVSKEKLESELSQVIMRITDIEGPNAISKLNSLATQGQLDEKAQADSPVSGAPVNTREIQATSRNLWTVVQKAPKGFFRSIWRNLRTKVSQTFRVIRGKSKLSEKEPQRPTNVAPIGQAQSSSNPSKSSHQASTHAPLKEPSQETWLVPPQDPLQLSISTSSQDSADTNAEPATRTQLSPSLPSSPPASSSPSSSASTSSVYAQVNAQVVAGLRQFLDIAINDWVNFDDFTPRLGLLRGHGMCVSLKPVACFFFASNQLYYAPRILGSGAYGTSFLAYPVIRRTLEYVDTMRPVVVKIGEIHARESSALYRTKQLIASHMPMGGRCRNLASARTEYCMIVMIFHDGITAASYLTLNIASMSMHTHSTVLSRIGDEITRWQDKFGLVHGDLHPGNIIVTGYDQNGLASDFAFIDLGFATDRYAYVTKVGSPGWVTDYYNFAATWISFSLWSLQQLDPSLGIHTTERTVTLINNSAASIAAMRGTLPLRFNYFEEVTQMYNAQTSVYHDSRGQLLPSGYRSEKPWYFDEFFYITILNRLSSSSLSARTNAFSTLVSALFRERGTVLTIAVKRLILVRKDDGLLVWKYR